MFSLPTELFYDRQLSIYFVHSRNVKIQPCTQLILSKSRVLRLILYVFIFLGLYSSSKDYMNEQHKKSVLFPCVKTTKKHTKHSLKYPIGYTFWHILNFKRMFIRKVFTYQGWVNMQSHKKADSKYRIDRNWYIIL